MSQLIFSLGGNLLKGSFDLDVGFRFFLVLPRRKKCLVSSILLLKLRPTWILQRDLPATKSHLAG